MSRKIKMNDVEDELFSRLMLFKQDWQEALHYFELSKSVSNEFVREGLTKIGIVTYAKPFMANTGVHSEVRKFKLDNTFIPEEYIWLHKLIMNYRGNFIGHSNFKTIKPEVGAWERSKWGLGRDQKVGNIP